MTKKEKEQLTRDISELLGEFTSLYPTKERSLNHIARMLTVISSVLVDQAKTTDKKKK